MLRKKRVTCRKQDYLFIGRHIPDSFLDTKDDSERQIQEKCFVQIYYNLSEKAKKNTKKGNWNLIRSHKMRSFFSSTLKGAGCEIFHVEFWLGHKIDGTKSAYFRGNPEGEKELYKKYVPFLTIQKEEDITANPIFQERESYRQAFIGHRLSTLLRHPLLFFSFLLILLIQTIRL